MIKNFIEQSINSNQPQAKWQIAELLGKIEIDNNIKYLEMLLKEQDNYVKRRALLSINRINKNTAKNLAAKYLNDPDQYLKFVSSEIINNEINL